MKKLIANMTVVALSIVAHISVSLAQDGPIPIHVEASIETGDHIGSQLIYLYKEQIRRSVGMSLRSAEEDALVSVKISTMDPVDTSRATVYSVVLTMRDLMIEDVTLWWYLGSTIGICSENSTKQCAENLIAMTDSSLDDVRALIADVVNELGDARE